MVGSHISFQHIMDVEISGQSDTSWSMVQVCLIHVQMSDYRLMDMNRPCTGKPRSIRSVFQSGFKAA